MRLIVCASAGSIALTARTAAVAVVVVVAAAGGSAGAKGDVAPDPTRNYTKIGEILIGGSGAFDYLSVDSTAHRLYVTHGTEVVAIDTATNAIVGRIADMPRVHGIAIAPNGRGFTSNGGENTVSIVDLKTLQTIGKVETGANPDAILYEPRHNEIYALNHTGRSATVIAADRGTVVATIPLAGTAEFGQADPGLGRVFVNIEDKRAVDVIDTSAHRVIANWPVAPAEEPTGMAIDTTAHRLLVGGGKSMVMIDASSGNVLASAPICTGTDASAYDPAAQLAFFSCGDGHITVVHVDAPDHLTVTQTIATAAGARTMTIDLESHRLYTVTQDRAPVDPAGGGRGRAPVPNTLRVLVYGRN
jgi:DNA-binding beta-propeller fold protein YncE